MRLLLLRLLLLSLLLLRRLLLHLLLLRLLLLGMLLHACSQSCTACPRHKLLHARAHTASLPCRSSNIEPQRRGQ